MKWFKGRQPQQYSLPNGQLLTCTVCQNESFESSSYKLNTSGMEFMGMAWANRDARCLICVECRHIHWFDF